jgi:hypothetical protein
MCAIDSVVTVTLIRYNDLVVVKVMEICCGQDGRDILDGSAVAGASRGNIEGGGLGGAGIGTLLQVRKSTGMFSAQNMQPKLG